MSEQEEQTCCFTVSLLANVEIAAAPSLTAQAVEVKRVETGQTKRFNFYGGGVGVGLHFGLSVGESDPVCCNAKHCPTLDDFAGSGSIKSLNISVLLGGGYIWVTFNDVGDCGEMSFSMGHGNIGAGGVHIGAQWGTFRSQ